MIEKKSNLIKKMKTELLYAELLFMTIVIDKDTGSAKEQFKAHKKEFKQASGFISIQRDLYAYYSLAEYSENEADKYAKLFEHSVKYYKYPKEAEIEKEQFDMATGNPKN